MGKRVKILDPFVYVIDIDFVFVFVFVFVVVFVFVYGIRCNAKHADVSGNRGEVVFRIVAVVFQPLAVRHHVFPVLICPSSISGVFFLHHLFVVL